MPGLVDYEALTSDGGVVRIRTTGPQDASSLQELHERISDDNLYLRFFSTNRAVAAEYVERLVARHQSDDHVALVAEDDGEIVAVASYERTAADEAEVAFLVDDSQHGRGIGTLLLEQLVVLARERGIRRLVADTLSRNADMLRVFADSGLVEERHISGGVVDLALGTAPAPGAIAGLDDRERVAEQHSLTPVLAPHTVAVIGAGRRPGGAGHEILRSIVEGGFTGQLFAVHPNASIVGGVPAYPTIADVPEHVDLAVIALPAAQVPGVVAECAAAGVHGAVVVTSGLGEIAGEGVERQRRMVHEARRHGMRIIGPNALGLVNTDPEVRLNATFADAQSHPGALALASQSGAVGIAVLAHIERRGIGLSDFVSLGNKADVSGNDLLLYWWQHPATRVIALYLESFGNPRKFGRLARRVGRHKPVLVVKASRSAGGPRGPSRTAAAASSETAVRALFAQAGVLRMETLPELLDVSHVLVDQPLPGGNRLGIVGNTGGAGVLAADAAAAVGLDVPTLSEQTRTLLRAAAPECTGDGNPVDLGAVASPAVLARAIEVLADSGELDSLVVVLADTRVQAVEAVVRAAHEALAAHVLPAALVVLGLPEAPAAGSPGLPVFPFPEPAVRALGRATEYAHWRRQPEGTVPRLSDVDLAAAQTAAAEFIREHPDGGWLGPKHAARLLGHVGVPLAPGGVANLEGAPEAGVEVVVGVTHEPLFGPVLMLAAGGALADLLDDRAWGILPLTDVDAERMLRQLKWSPLLDGFRGGPVTDRAALLDLLHRVAQLADAVPELAEMDLNPVIVTSAGVVAVEAKVRLDPRPADPDPYVRRLR